MYNILACQQGRMQRGGGRWGMVRNYVVPGLWLLWAAYWKATASRVKPSARRAGGFGYCAQVAALAVAGALLLAPSDLFTGFGARFFPAGDGLFWTGTGLTAVGLLFAAWARRQLGTNWSGPVTIKRGHELVTTGPYALARHPIYSGLLVAFAGSALSLGEWRGLAAVVIAGIALWSKLTKEERWLLEEFGPAYEAYRDRVRALIPYFL